MCIPALAQSSPSDEQIAECQQLEDLDRTIAACTAILESSVTNDEYAVWATYNRGIAYSRKRDRAKALADLDKAISIDPRYELAHRAKGIEYFRAGDFRSAASALDSAIRLNSTNTNTIYLRGIANFKLGLLDSAIADFNSVLAVNPLSPEAVCGRGMAYEEKGDLTKAIADYRLVLTIVATTEIGQQALAYAGASLARLGPAEPKTQLIAASISNAQAPDLDPPGPRATTASNQRPDAAATVRVYFGSDRDRTGSTEPEKFYGFARSRPSYGYSDVTIPHNHQMGVLESPVGVLQWRFQYDQKKHVTVVSIDAIDAGDFFARLQADARATEGPKQALVFIHGYATSFHDALRRTAQIKYDLNFLGLAILYSWPSTGDERNYGADEDSIAWSANNMREFLAEVSRQSGAEEIFLVGHSMGSRGLAAAVSAIVSNAAREISARYKQIILAAPDIDRDIFKDHLFPAIRRAGIATTLYASSRDKALDLSKIGHTYPRLGSTSPSPFIAEGIVTIDASGVDSSFWGHSYYAENRSIISDMYYLIRDTPLASRFGLQSVESEHGKYWRFKR
jgi:esterase/lipase superfamily enzyme/Flp pilus assembly protein TadD